MNKGLGIHIKPSQVGSFTAYCKRNGYKRVTNECINQGKASKNKAIKKKATFAGSSRSWNH